MSRRAMGVVALVLMAHVTFASTALACASAVASVPALSGHHGRDQSSARVNERHQGDLPEPHRTPCSTPGGLDCCGAVMPCGDQMVMATTVTTAAVIACNAGHTLLRLRAPTSPVTSPDPPPPKA